MTSDSQTANEYETRTSEPIPIMDAYYYFYPGDQYVYEEPSDGGTGTVVRRIFHYDPSSETSGIGYEIERGVEKRTSSTKSVGKNSLPPNARQLVYFSAHKNETIQYPGGEEYKVIAREISFRVSTDDAIITLPVTKV